tara:strand:+ start:495 stop:968 length:474 start_codon:yes stop_codon:yes gene_type:complete
LEKIKNKKPNKDSLKRIGNLIKEARLKNNDSISQLATDLKISAQQFQAIEEGQEELLPEKVFVKAMIKRISERLKLDTDFLIKEFNNHSDENDIEEIIEEVNKEKKINNQPNKDISYIFLIAVFISGVIGLLASSVVLNIFTNLDNNSVKEETIKRD